MDYLTWVERVLQASVDARAARPPYTMLMAADVVEQLGFAPPVDLAAWQDGAGWATLSALLELARLGAIEKASAFNGVYVTDKTTETRHVGLRRLTWPRIFGAPLAPGPRELLEAVISVCHEPSSDYAILRETDAAELGDRLGRDFTSFEGQAAFQELLAPLARHEFIGRRYPRIAPVYAGAVRVLGNEQWEWEEVLRNRQAEWERPYTEFKEALDLGTERGKEKLVRSCVALANTMADATRLLIVGFDDDSHEFTASVDPTQFTSDRIENILSIFTAPIPDVIVRHIRFANGIAGAVEVRREPMKLPYRVAKRIGKTEPGPLIRHGTHNERPTDAELAALVSEGA